MSSPNRIIQLGSVMGTPSAYFNKLIWLSGEAICATTDGVRVAVTLRANLRFMTAVLENSDGRGAMLASHINGRHFGGWSRNLELHGWLVAPHGPVRPRFGLFKFSAAHMDGDYFCFPGGPGQFCPPFPGLSIAAARMRRSESPTKRVAKRK